MTRRKKRKEKGRGKELAIEHLLLTRWKILHPMLLHMAKQEKKIILIGKRGKYNKIITVGVSDFDTLFSILHNF